MNKRILIVEDEKAMSDTLSIKLKSEGFRTKIANDGEEALSIITKSSISNKDPFDLIIVDLVMPKMDGFQLLSELKKMDYKVPIFVASNLDQNEDIERALELGAIDHFVKSSVTLTEIVNKIKKILN